MPTKKPNDSRWQCPDCGRRFAFRTKEHSCEITSLDVHLSRALPEVLETFEALRRLLDAIGPHHLNPLKTMITISASVNFGGLKVGKTFVDLSVFLRRRVAHPRLDLVGPLSPDTFIYRIRLTRPREVNDEIEGWLREAYVVGMGRTRK